MLSLHLNEESKDDQIPDDRNMVETMENESLNITVSQVGAGKDSQMSCITGTKVQDTAEDTCNSTEFVPHHECLDETQVPERLSTSLGSSSNEPKKSKRHLYDVRWEEISTSPVQAKIYWEVAIKKITRQKVILRTLRQKVKRLKKTILELRTRVKHVANSDS
ncbi:uncharacterized protein LOC114940901 [Nylanderia fulva]|uniref:uncharacterized protein LOC114940901 n=1 Tax=Nylanderia fulva TaxID=613905 RepID=UPI0010FBA487|nr:uncharacterized protein LOC114940901 [Nylanderia fulva]